MAALYIEPTCDQARRSKSPERPIYTGPGVGSIFAGPPADVVAESGVGRSDVC